MFRWFKRGAQNGNMNGRVGASDSISLNTSRPFYTVDELISKFDGDNLRYIVRTIVDVCPSLVHQFYARLAFRVHLEDTSPPQFGIFDFSDEEAYWSIASGLSFDFDESAFTEFLKQEFEAAAADLIIRLLRGYIKSFNITIDGREYEGNSAVLKFFEDGVYSTALLKSESRLFDYIYDLACDMRDKDIKKFKSEVEDRKVKIIPLVNNARRSAYNKYGDFDGNIYYDEINQFLEYLFESRDFPFFHNCVAFQPIAYCYFDDLLDEIAEIEVVPENGHDFEHWVAAQLVKAGWTANVTQASGDDGVDVVAKREGITVAVQCKRYAGSVGNKAVQEVYAGMKHLQLARAVVISTGQYTKAAKKLANSTGVLLLSEGDIPHIWELLNA